MSDNTGGTVVDLESVPATVPKRTGPARKSRKRWTISVHFAGTLPGRPTVPASPYTVGDAGRFTGTDQTRRCKYAALIADMDPAQAAELDRRLARPNGEIEVVRVLRLAGLALSVATPYRHKRGQCSCRPTEGTTS